MNKTSPSPVAPKGFAVPLSARRGVIPFTTYRPAHLPPLASERQTILVEETVDDGLDLFGAVVAAEIIESVIEDDFISTDTSFDTDS